MTETLYFGGQKMHGKDPTPPVSVLAGKGSDPAKWDQRVANDRLEFRTIDAAEPDLDCLPKVFAENGRGEDYCEEFAFGVGALGGAVGGL